MALAFFALAAVVASPPALSPSACPADILRAFRSSSDASAIARALAALPLLSSSYDVVSARPSTVPHLDAQPTHGLLEDSLCLLRAVTDSVVEHISGAVERSHPLASLTVEGEAPDLLAAARHVASFADSSDGSPRLLEVRMSFESALSRAASLAAPWSALVHAAMRPSVRMVAGRFNVAFLASLLDSISFPDTSLPVCLCEGFPIVGHCPDSCSPGFRRVERGPIPDITKLPNAAWNRALGRRVARDFASGRSPWAGVLWTKTLDEVTRGTTCGPFSASDLDSRYGPGRWRAMLRFAVEQLRADGGVKIRCCDDAAASLHNEATSLGETITCERSDFPARVAAIFYSMVPEGLDWSFCLGTEDIEMAYRQCPSRTPQFTVVCLADPATGEPAYFVLPGMNFGLASAVNQFNRIPEAVVAFLRRRCGVCVTHYFDDYCVAEPSFAGATGQRLLISLHRLIGMPLASEKHVPMAPRGVFLGILHDFSRFRRERVVVMAPKPGRAAAIVAAAAAILLAGWASVAHASSLVGRLQFLMTTVGHGVRVVRSLVYSLHAFSSARRHARYSALSDMIRHSLQFLVLIVPRLRPRIIDLLRIARSVGSPPVVVWSDAMWQDATPNSPACGGLGFVVWLPPGHPGASPAAGRFLYSHRRVSLSDLPFRSRDHSLIGQLELLAAAAAYTSIPGHFDGADVIHFIDNTSALYGLVKGYSAVPDSAAIIRAFHMANISIGANVWFNYVATKANVADLPSRGALLDLFSILRRFLPSFDPRGDEVPFCIPVVGHPVGRREVDVWSAIADQIAPAPRRSRGERRGRRGH